MHVDLSADQKQFRDDIQDYFARMMTPELVDEIRGSEGGGPLYTKALRQMGQDGLLGIGWPKEYGGQDRSAIEQYIFSDEVQRAGFPLPFLTLNTVGPTIMRYGSEEQKRDFLPRILAGELQFCIGYSEPEAGTDLAALRTRAVRDGDEWVINGQKMWTSLASFADYVWLAARTDPDAPKHRGISMFLVPTSAPGFSVSPVGTVGGVRTNATFYEDVRVPGDALIGGLNNGWSLIVGQLNHERVSLMPVGHMSRALREVTEWARDTKLRDGRRVLDQDWVRRNLAFVKTRVDVLRLLNWRMAWAATQGHTGPAESSAVKVFGSEFNIAGYRALLEILGENSKVQDGSPGAILRGSVESRYRNGLILTFGGGTNEIQRDIIAMAGLGLPHYKS